MLLNKTMYVFGLPDASNTSSSHKTYSMKTVKQAFFFVVLVSTITACSKSFMIDGKKARQVTVTDLGEMYSTYNMSEAERREVSSQLNNKALLDEIIRYSKENTWPDGVNTLDDRLNSRTTMAKYNFYKVATFGSRTIVSIPKEKNGHMPASFVPTGPMYMIFASSVVKMK